MPRLPLEGGLDLTYRCNNNCRHCWVRIAPSAPESSQELAFEEIRDIADQARLLGTREWAISGGEPMLRHDFADVFDYLTRKSTGYSLNTNGTLITSKSARLLKRRGTKMIALYGATAEVNDHITRCPGSFQATLQGMAYMREVGAGFMVQAHSNAGQLPPVAGDDRTGPIAEPVLALRRAVAVSFTLRLSEKER